MSVAFEIAVLQREERRMDADSAEADRMIRDLIPIYKCDFVVANMIDDVYVPLPPGWQAGVDNPAAYSGVPDKSRRGAIAVSIDMLRRIHRQEFRR